MKLNIAYPVTGCQVQFEVNDDKRLKSLIDKRLRQVIRLDDVLGEDFKGYIGKITGGSDKQGFPMMNGVLTVNRVRLLLKAGVKCFKSAKRDGERRRRSVRGCIIEPANLSVLCIIIIKKGDKEVPGLTDKTVPRSRGPKRANKIRKMFNVAKGMDVRPYVMRRIKPGKFKKNGKPVTTAPKIQRLITPQRLQRKRHLRAVKKARRKVNDEAKLQYIKLLAAKKKRDRKRSSRRSSTRLSTSSK